MVITAQIVTALHTSWIQLHVFFSSWAYRAVYMADLFHDCVIYQSFNGNIQSGITWIRAATMCRLHHIMSYRSLQNLCNKRCNSLLWAMLSVMSFEVGTSYSAQSVPYMEGNALCCCKDSANLCSLASQPCFTGDEPDHPRLCISSTQSRCSAFSQQLQKAGWHCKKLTHMKAFASFFDHIQGKVTWKWEWPALPCCFS